MLIDSVVWWVDNCCLAFEKHCAVWNLRLLWDRTGGSSQLLQQLLYTVFAIWLRLLSTPNDNTDNWDNLTDLNSACVACGHSVLAPESFLYDVEAWFGREQKRDWTELLRRSLNFAMHLCFVLYTVTLATLGLIDASYNGEPLRIVRQSLQRVMRDVESVMPFAMAIGIERNKVVIHVWVQILHTVKQE